MRPKTLAIPSPIEMTVPNSLRSFYLKMSKISSINTMNKSRLKTYDLVDRGNLGLKNGNGISDGWLLVGNSRGSEGSSAVVNHRLSDGKL